MNGSHHYICHECNSKLTRCTKLLKSTGKRRFDENKAKRSFPNSPNTKRQRTNECGIIESHQHQPPVPDHDGYACTLPVSDELPMQNISPTHDEGGMYEPHQHQTAAFVSDHDYACPLPLPGELPTQNTSRSPIAAPSDELLDALPKVSRSNTSLNPREKAVELLKSYRYGQLFRLLAKESTAAKTAMVEVVGNIVKSEVSKKSNTNAVDTLMGALTMDRLKKFSLSNTVQEIKVKLPMLAIIVLSLLPGLKKTSHQKYLGRRKERRPLNATEGRQTLNLRFVHLIATVLHFAHPRKYKFYQSIIGVELWRRGTPNMVTKLLNNLGLTMSQATVRSNVDKLIAASDKKIKDWKSNQNSKQTKKSKDLPVRRSLKLAEKKLQESDKHKPNTFSLCTDNVQLSVKAKHQTSDAKNRFLMYALSYAVQDRTHTPTNDHTLQIDSKPAVELSPWEFLPTPEDFQNLRKRMVVIVSRILAIYMTAYSDSETVRHIPHLYSEEMRQESDICGLGVLDANPSTTIGSIKICDHLSQYVPTTEEGQVCPVPLNGDQMTVERAKHAKRGRVKSKDDLSKLLGVIECPQEFHKEGILMDTLFEKYFTQTSMEDRGTLYNLKTRFDRRGASRNVMHTFQHSYDLMKLTTEGYVLLLAMHIANITNLDEDPEMGLMQLSEEVVDRVWLPYKQAEYEDAAEAMAAGGGEFPYCSCHTDTGDDMVQCASINCTERWFHLPCVDLQHVPAGIWFCSDECQMSGTLNFCSCRQHKGTPLVTCGRGSDCTRYEKYHRECVELRGQEEGSPWYCCDECELTTDDFVQNHSRQLLWDCLNILANRDAVREGDGEAMVLMWKFNLPYFYSTKHPKYTILAHDFLAKIGGIHGESIAHRLKWERTANIKGGDGRNIGLDLVNEFLNNYFKDRMLRSGGHYTDQQVKRCAIMGTEFGKEFSYLFFDSLGIGQTLHHAPGDKALDDVKIMVEEYQADNLFAHIPNRQHTAFKNFKAQPEMRTPVALGKKLASLSEDLDEWNEEYLHTMERDPHEE